MKGIMNSQMGIDDAQWGEVVNNDAILKTHRKEPDRLPYLTATQEK
jgi:hypothetical protein